MRTLAKILSISILVFNVNQLNAQENKIKQWEEKAFQAYENSSIFMWKQLATQADQVLSKADTDKESKVAAIKLKYGLLYGCLSNQDKDTYEQYLEKTLEQMNTLLEEYPKSSDLYCISAALMSIQMGFTPMKGMTLGSLSGKHIDQSIKLDSLSAMAWRQYAGSKYFTPKMWGGDIEEAIKKYEYSIKLYEKQNLTQDWTYVDAIVWLGIAYRKVGKTEKAKAAFEKALTIAPEFGWVKNQLLPSVSQL